MAGGHVGLYKSAAYNAILMLIALYHKHVFRHPEAQPLQERILGSVTLKVTEVNNFESWAEQWIK
jgi:hypothetical protein